MGYMFPLVTPVRPYHFDFSSFAQISFLFLLFLSACLPFGSGDQASTLSVVVVVATLSVVVVVERCGQMARLRLPPLFFRSLRSYHEWAILHRHRLPEVVTSPPHYGSDSSKIKTASPPSLSSAFRVTVESSRPLNPAQTTWGRLFTRGADGYGSDGVTVQVTRSLSTSVNFQDRRPSLWQNASSIRRMSTNERGPWNARVGGGIGGRGRGGGGIGGERGGERHYSGNRNNNSKAEQAKYEGKLRLPCLALVLFFLPGIPILDLVLDFLRTKEKPEEKC